MLPFYPLVIVRHHSPLLRLRSGVRWSLVDVWGSVVRQIRQVKSSVDYARNRFSEPVPKAYSFVLRAVLVVHTRISVPKEGDVDFTGHARQTQCVFEGMAE